MKVMVIVKASKSSEAGKMPSNELLTAMGNFNETLVKAGIMEAGEGLKPSSEGCRVRFSGEQRIVTKGPFPETSELVAGYWLWNVASMDEAIEWLQKCPNPMEEESDIEIRPLFEMADFSEIDADGKVCEQEEQLKNAISSRNFDCKTYLFFNGQCEEALSYYQQHLGASTSALIRFSESPEPMPEGMLPEGYENKVMHCEFSIGNAQFMATDHDCQGMGAGGFSITLTVPSADEAHRTFDALADSGNIQMPLSKTFWSPLYGQVTDKFGIAWMIMQESEQP
ncbi:YciI family protein [Thalassotalea fusca]